MTAQPRIHISLNVANLPASLAFYETFLGAAPAKSRADYAKFAPDELAINLALNPVDETESSSRVSHFGIQLDSPEAVRAAERRLRKAGLVSGTEDQVTCCYAVQDKVWAVDPDGNAWEVFAVTQKDTEVHSARDSGPAFSCCPTEAESGCC